MAVAAVGDEGPLPALVVAVAAVAVAAGLPSAAAICAGVRPDAAAAAAAKISGAAAGVASGECVIAEVAVPEGVAVDSVDCSSVSGGEGTAGVGKEGAAVCGDAVSCVNGITDGVGADDGVDAEVAGCSAGAGSAVVAGVDGQHARKLPAVQAMFPEPVVQVEVGS